MRINESRGRVLNKPWGEFSGRSAFALRAVGRRDHRDVFFGDSTPTPAPAPKASKTEETWKQRLWRRTKQVVFIGAVMSGLYTYGAHYLFNKDPIQTIQTVHRTTQPMPKELVDILKPYFDQSPYPVDFENLQVIPEFSPFFKKHNHVLPGFHGTVVLSNDDYEAYVNFDKLTPWHKHWMTTVFAHEITHLIQMQMLGRDAFLEKIARDYVDREHVYDTEAQVFKDILKSMKDTSKPEYFVHPELTLEQNAMLIELYVGSHLPPPPPPTPEQILIHQYLRQNK